MATLFVSAIDGSGQQQRTRPRRFRIVSEKELIQFYETELDQIFRKLSKSSDDLSGVLENLKQLENNLSGSPAPRVSEIQNQIQGVRQEFQRFHSRTFLDTDAEFERITEIARFVPANHISTPSWMNDLVAAIRDLQRCKDATGQLLQRQNVTEEVLRRNRQKPLSPELADVIRDRLTRQADSLTQMIDYLRNVETRFASWIDSRAFVQSLQIIRQGQIHLLGQTKPVWQAMVGQGVEGTEEHRASYSRLGKRQRSLLTQLNRLLRNLQASSTGGENSVGNRAIDLLGQASSKMDLSCDDLANGRLGRSLQNQQAIVDHLQSAIDLLANQKSTAPSAPTSVQAAELVANAIQRLSDLSRRVIDANRDFDSGAAEKHRPRIRKAKQDSIASLSELNRWLQQNGLEREAHEIERSMNDIRAHADVELESLDASARAAQRKLQALLPKLDAESHEAIRSRLYQMVAKAIGVIAKRQSELYQQAATAAQTPLAAETAKTLADVQRQIGSDIDISLTPIESLMAIDIVRGELGQAIVQIVERIEKRQLDSQTLEQMRILHQQLTDLISVFAPSPTTPESTKPAQSDSNADSPTLDPVALRLILTIQNQLLAESERLGKQTLSPTDPNYDQQIRRIKRIAEQQLQLGTDLDRLIRNTTDETPPASSDLPPIPDF